MATIITGKCGRDAYRDVLQHILKYGRERAPRGRKTLDLGATIIELATPLNALPLDVGRNVNWSIGAVEAAQLIGAMSRADLLLKIAPQFAAYMDGDSFHGSYGARIRNQMIWVEDKLKDDHETRQAIATLWDGKLDNIPNMHDYPCTVALQFEFAGGTLCMNTFMRSNDVWLGLPYDMFQFTQLQFSLAKSLNVPVGTYRHIALSMHLYEEDVLAASKIHVASEERWQPIGIGRVGDDFLTIIKRARRLMGGLAIEDPTRSEDWYRDRFARYLG